MGRLRSKKRSTKIKQRQKRRQKLNKLRQLYLKTESETEKERIFTKVLKLAPWLTKKEFEGKITKIDKDVITE